MGTAVGAGRSKEGLACEQVDKFSSRLLDYVGLLRQESLKAEASHEKGMEIWE